MSHLAYRIDAPLEIDAADVLDTLRRRLPERAIAPAGDLLDVLETPLAAYGLVLIPADGYDLEVRPIAGRCFLAWPGIGCEALALGLARYPAAVYDPFTARPRSTGLDADWHWRGSCHTGAALLQGPGRFVACHRAACAALEEAAALGLGVEVDDPTGFWESRDPRLLAEAAAAAG